jgi:hypothetical protein
MWSVSKDILGNIRGTLGDDSVTLLTLGEVIAPLPVWCPEWHVL